MSSKLASLAGGFEAVAVIMSRCRLGAWHHCACTVVTVGVGPLSNGAKRVARRTVSAQTATSTTSAHQRWCQSYL